MKKKKISKEDLELNYEVLGASGSNNTHAASDTCGDATYNTCVYTKANTQCVNCGQTKIVTCDTTLTSVIDCKTKENGDGCNTANTFVCETLNCVNSQSNAELCCATTKYEGCKETVDYCNTAATVCIDSYNVCPATHNTICNLQSKDLDNCNLKPFTYADDCDNEVTDFCVTDFCLQTAGFNCNQP